MRGLVGDSTITKRVFPGMMAALTALQGRMIERQEVKTQVTTSYAMINHRQRCLHPSTTAAACDLPDPTAALADSMHDTSQSQPNCRYAP